jgi:hypothetical protein
MAGFSELWPFGGVGPWPGSTFMMAPKDGADLVILEGASPLAGEGNMEKPAGLGRRASQEGRHG